MLEIVHGVTCRDRKKSKDNKYDTFDEVCMWGVGIAGLVFWIFHVVLTNEFKCINSVRKSRTALLPCSPGHLEGEPCSPTPACL